MNYDEYLKKNPEFAARQKEKHSTPVASATTEGVKSPVRYGSTTSTNTSSLYPALVFLFFIALALSLSITLGLTAKASFGGDAFILAIILSCIISLFLSAIFFFIGDVVKYLKEINEILKNR